MADEIRSAAHAVVDDVITGVSKELSKNKGCKGSIFCTLFNPSKSWQLSTLLRFFVILSLLSFIISGVAQVKSYSLLGVICWLFPQGQNNHEVAFSDVLW